MNEVVDRGAWLPLKANRRDEDTGGDAHEAGRILIVDDEFEIRHMILNYLTDQNVRAIPVQGRQELARQLAAGEPSLIVLDLCLGEDDGLDLLRDIRSRSDVPVIITTGHRLDEVDVVLGLELGADDYLAKPFGLRELLARIRAVLRRREAKLLVAERDTERGRHRFGGWQLDRRRRRLTNPDGFPVMLTKGEYTLLTAFVDAPQRPLSREHLMRASRVHEDVFDRSIDVQILRLRRKLEVDPSAPQIIRTERGVGYVSPYRSNSSSNKSAIKDAEVFDRLRPTIQLLTDSPLVGRSRVRRALPGLNRKTRRCLSEKESEYRKRQEAAWYARIE